MCHLSQIKSQVKLLLFFHNFFPLYRILLNALFFPIEFYNQRGKARIPWAINLLITSRCNLNCVMCNFRLLLNVTNDEELTFDNIRDFLKREHRRKFHIFLSGGEPFLRDDIYDILREIKNYNLVCGICTNGTLLDKRKIKDIIKLKIEYLMFSLHGPQNIHDEITGVQDSFKKLYENVIYLRSLSNKIKIFFNCAITKLNLDYLEDIAKIAEELKVNALRFEHLNFITPQEVKRNNEICEKEFPHDKIILSSYFNYNIEGNNIYYEHISKMREVKSKFKIPIYFKPYLDKMEIKSWYSNNFAQNRKCIFVWKSLFINSAGDIIPCQFLIYKLGNIKTDTLEEVWNNKKYRELRLKLRRGLLPGCSRCCKL